ncbi:MAG: hypothetical protein HeimC3_08890 [Candidatus Heimdallarchaeota archaeon LC_3]|nr:MAG: hypothetical protein HeimC3_08890 [Candidatus Heimdallarchaeota archaeon LC_3]
MTKKQFSISILRLIFFSLIQSDFIPSGSKSRAFEKHNLNLTYFTNIKNNTICYVNETNKIDKEIHS